jgi:hypothetical protein
MIFDPKILKAGDSAEESKLKKKRGKEIVSKKPMFDSVFENMAFAYKRQRIEVTEDCLSNIYDKIKDKGSEKKIEARLIQSH